MPSNDTARWRRRKDARPAEILDAALDCFAERGFAATRLDDVARRAGVTKGTLYLYFQSKEELFKAVVRTNIVPRLEQFERLAEASPGPASAILRQLLTGFPKMAAASRISAIPKLVIAEARNFPDLASFYFEEVVSRARSLIKSILTRGIASGEFRAVDIDHAFFSLIGPILLSMLWKHSLEPCDSRPLDIEALAASHLDFVLHALAPEAAR